MEFASCLEKQECFKKKFLSLNGQEKKYKEVIELGRKAPKMSFQDETKDNLVPGCQSLLYLKVEKQNGVLCIQTSSDALISAGLAQLLVQVYNGEPPEAVLKCPPLFLKEIGLLESLSPTRANGLKSLYQKLQKISLRLLASK